MEDRELLELAAKAVGITGLDFDYCEREDHGFYFGPRLPASMGIQAMCHKYWCPVDDDGDAFRLAAYLRLEVIPGKHAGDGCIVNSRRHEIPGVTVFRDSKDMAEQMRRAIVMAAAEIGKTMQ